MLGDLDELEAFLFCGRSCLYYREIIHLDAADIGLTRGCMDKYSSRICCSRSDRYQRKDRAQPQISSLTHYLYNIIKGRLDKIDDCVNYRTAANILAHVEIHRAIPWKPWNRYCRDLPGFRAWKGENKGGKTGAFVFPNRWG